MPPLAVLRAKLSALGRKKLATSRADLDRHPGRWSAKTAIKNAGTEQVDKVSKPRNQQQSAVLEGQTTFEMLQTVIFKVPNEVFAGFVYQRIASPFHLA